MLSPQNPVSPISRSQPQGLCSRCEAVLYRAQSFCGECGSPAPPRGWPLCRSQDDIWLGTTVADRWFVTKKVGAGSTGAVYRVESLEGPRRLALKVIDLDKPANRSREENLESARNEVEVVCQLVSSHIVAIHEMLVLDGKHVAIVMDYVEGLTLRDVVAQEGPLQPERAVGILRQVSAGLDEAHAHGIVHRDVKPENLLLERLPDGSDFVRVTDFGIASPAQSPSPTGLFIGTPLWASPEQVLGLPLDRRSDIYSLGATLFYLLTGQPPFTDDGYRKILSAHISMPAPRLRDVGPRHYSPPLENFVARMLNKSPDDRPRSMRHVLSHLETLTAREDWSRTHSFFDSTTPIISLEEESATAMIEATPRGNCMQEVAVPVPLDHRHCASIRSGRIVSAAGAKLDVTTLVPRSVHSFALPRPDARAVAHNHDMALVGHADGSIVTLRFDSEPEVRFRCPDGRPIAAVALDRAGRLQIAGTGRGDLYARGLSTEARWELVGRGEPISAVCVSHDAQLFAVARGSGSVEIFSASSPRDPFVILPSTRARGLAMTEDGHLLAVLDENEHVQVWAVDTGQRLYEADRESGTILSIQFADRTLMGLCEDDGAAFLLDLQCRHASGCRPNCTLCHLEQPDA